MGVIVIAGAVNADYGVIATDSVSYDSAQDKVFYEGMRLFYSERFILSYTGKPVYFAKLDIKKLNTDIPSLVIYMKDYLQKMKEEVEKEDKDFCLFVLGIHKKLPTLIQLNSFLNFTPKYLYSEGSTKFSTLTWGKEDTKEMTVYMESLLKKQEVISPGIVGEVLSKGIYKKGRGKGMINAAWMKNDGKIFTLSGTLGA